jgi:hypothetical protein
MYVRMYVCMYVCIYVCKYVYVYVCIMYVCMYVYRYVSISIFTGYRNVVIRSWRQDRTAGKELQRVEVKNDCGLVMSVNEHCIVSSRGFVLHVD